MFVLSLLIFIAFCLVYFTLPGLSFIYKFNPNLLFWEKITLSTVFGFVLFSLISYIFLILNLPFLIWLLLPLVLISSRKNLTGFFKNFSLPAKKELIQIMVILLLGVAGQMAVIIPSGQISNEGITFYSAHGHDGPWHIALMEELKKDYPWQNPVYAGEKLVNYHFFSDIAPSIISNLPTLSVFDIYFRFFPLFYSLLLGSLAFILGKKIGGSFSSGIWSTVFTYFCGSFGYILTWLQNQTISGESIFWVTQTQSSSGNPPQIAALIIILAFIYVFPIFLKNRSWTSYFICTVLAGSLIVFKVYGGVVLLGSLGLVGIWQFIKDRNWSIFSLAISSFILSLCLYLPNTKNSASFLIFEPWWYIRTMVVATNRLNWLDLELQRQTYLSEGNWKRVVQVESIAFLIFFIGNLGMRVFGLHYFLKLTKNVLNNYFYQLIVLIVISSFILPLIFLQKGVASNTIQFMQYFLLIFGILAGVSTTKIISKLKHPFYKALFSIIFISLLIPTQLGLINDFYNNPPVSRIDNSEIGALEYLKRNSLPNSIILTPLYNNNTKLSVSTPPIWAWFDTAYVSALSARRVFLEDYEQVDIMGYDLKNRQEVEKEIFSEEDPKNFVNLLTNKEIDYIYFPITLAPKVNLRKTGLKLFYKNNNVEIWQSF